MVLDPPRRGLAELIPFILRLKPRRIIHIACDPAAGARDLKSLIQGGYRLRDLALLDFFPQTFHLETASLLTRG